MYFVRFELFFFKQSIFVLALSSKFHETFLSIDTSLRLHIKYILSHIYSIKSCNKKINVPIATNASETIYSIFMSWNAHPSRSIEALYLTNNPILIFPLHNPRLFTIIDPNPKINIWNLKWFQRTLKTVYFVCTDFLFTI